MRDTDFVGGFAKGLRVIEAFGEDRSRLSIADVSKATRLDRATARRCLLTLTELGYAQYDGKYFVLSPRILRLGHGYLSGTKLPAIIQPQLDLLSAAVGESASASVLDETEIVYIARASLKRVISINLMAGSRLPAYCASMGRILLAWLDETKARAALDNTKLLQRTPFTLTDPDELMAELRRIRAQGYAINDRELDSGLRSIAVPLFNHCGAVVAALNVGAPVAHVEIGDLTGLFLPEMLKIQSQLRAMLR